MEKAKQKVCHELYERLDSKERERDLYCLVRLRDQAGRDDQQVRVIEDKNGKVVMSEEQWLRRKKENFKKPEELRK